MIGDIGLSKSRARRAGLFPTKLTVHYGLLPRANRGIFAKSSTNCPISPRKIEVGLFNIMQEGDVQIKGIPGASSA